MTDTGYGAKFIQVAPDTSIRPTPWEPLLVTRHEIAEEIARLSDLSGPDAARRSSEIVHPSAAPFKSGITPGMSISINLLLPGESLVIDRDNANRFEFGIGGSGRGLMGERRLAMGRWDGWTIPSMTRREYRNDGQEPFVWLSYSNAPLLDRLGIHYSDAMESKPRANEPDAAEQAYRREGAPDYPILGDGARLRGYEFLTDIEVVENKALLWPWDDVSKHVAHAAGDNQRTIMLLYNPATERRNGTTHSFFATISSHPPGPGRPVPPRGHRHSSFACNYHFQGAGSSVVNGQRFDWEAGDLMLSAPSWSEHAHGSAPQGSSVLTVQDHPFQIGIESLIWQERFDGAILTLGSEPGQTGYVGPRLAGD